MKDLQLGLTNAEMNLGRGGGGRQVTPSIWEPEGRDGTSPLVYLSFFMWTDVGNLQSHILKLG